MKMLYKIGSVLKTKEGTVFDVQKIELTADTVNYKDGNNNEYAQDDIAKQFREVTPRVKKVAKTAAPRAKKAKAANQAETTI